MIRAAVLVVALALSACATVPDNPATNPEAAEPLVCATRAQCDIYWQRAQAWIASNSAYKIQITSDAVIQTFGPFGSRVDLAYTVSRVPNADGSARILISPRCDNFIGCYPTRTDAVIAFKRFVRG